MSASEWTRQELRGAWDRVVDGLTKTAIATVRRKEAIWQVAAYLRTKPSAGQRAWLVSC